MTNEVQNPITQLLGDPRVRDIEPKFSKIISDIALAFGKLAQIKGRRATHSYGTVAKGVLEVVKQPDIPPHRLFASEQRYPVLLRHANIKGFQDDAIQDGRGATLRILNGKANASIDELDLNAPVLDVLMSTGRCFILPDAASFASWVAGSMADRANMLQKFPKITPIFEEIIRNPESYTKLHYYSETTYLFVGIDSKEYYLRYRLINADYSPDTGFINPADVRMPLDYLPRLENDTRPKDYLQLDFRKKVKNKEVKYLLQFQLREALEDQAANEDAKDCTIPWDETQYPCKDVAVISLTSIVPDELAEPLEFNPYHAPADLSLILAHSINETASVNHLRSIVYQISANMRKYQLPSAELVNWGIKGNQPDPKQLYPYSGQPGIDIPRFDFNRDLPARVQPKPRYMVNFGIHLFPARPFGVSPMLGISGVAEIMQATGQTVPKSMPSNLTRCRPDKFEDKFFVERRLIGFNPGKFNPVSNQCWQYVIRYDCSNYVLNEAGILPTEIEARFTLEDQALSLHSIKFTLDEQSNPETYFPGDGDWEWSKRLFRSAEFVFQEIQSHLGRTHMNMDQYAMSYYRNVVNNPIRLLLEPHFEGLLNINKLGDALILGENGFIPIASALNPASVKEVLKKEITKLSYRKWTPAVQALKHEVKNNYFDRAAASVWEVLEDYVSDFFEQHQAGIQSYWSEIEAMSEDLVSHSILDPKLETLAITNITHLKKLCVYAIYHSTFLHSWMNNKQYEDGGDIDYATIGLWDGHHPKYNPNLVAQKHSSQVSLLWTLSNTRYNPVMEYGSSGLKDRLWKRRTVIQPGIPLESIMMSTNI
jgi:linolenate 9R-lipoxygenase